MYICPPFRFDLTGVAQPGKNTLRIEVATTLERALINEPNFFGPPAGSPPAPTGMIGPAVINFLLSE